MPQKDHFIPKTYLDAFADAGRGHVLHVYSKRTSGYRVQKSSKVCRVNDGDRNDWFENPYILREILSHVEPRWREHSRAIEAGEISGDALYAVAFIMAYILACSPTAARLSRQGLQATMETLRPMMARIAQTIEDAPPARRGDLARMMLDPQSVKIEIHKTYPRAIGMQNVLSIAKSLMTGRWDIIASGVVPFLTSDYPTASLLDADGEVLPGHFFPITPRCGAIVWPRPRQHDRAEIDPNEILHPQSLRSVAVPPELVNGLNVLIAQQAEDLILSSGESSVVHALARRYGRWRADLRMSKIGEAGSHYLLGRRFVGPVA